MIIARGRSGILATMVEDWHLRRAQGGGRVSYVLVFDEGVAVIREDLVAEAVMFLRTLPGVTEVEHADREILEITAHAVPAERLTEEMRGWWNAAQREKRPWIAAVDRAADLVSAFTAAHGYQRQDWELFRVLDEELRHVIVLDHEFGYGRSEHILTVTARIRLALPDLQWFTVAQYTGELDADAELAQFIAGRVLPALDSLSTVDAMLERWQGERSIEEGASYTLAEARLHARVLVSRGRLDEARRVYQRDFDHSQPQQRPYLLEQIAGLGVPPLTTGTNPHLSVAEEATLAAWQANQAATVDRLRAVTGLPLDGSRQSADELWSWLRDSSDRLQTTFGGATPSFAVSYYGVHAGSGILSGKIPFEPWYRFTVELVTAYLGQVVTTQAPGTQWGIGRDGELAMARHNGTGLLWRVATIVHQAFDAPVDQFDPHRLRRLVDDMIQWVNDARYTAWIVRVSFP